MGRGDSAPRLPLSPLPALSLSSQASGADDDRQELAPSGSNLPQVSHRAKLLVVVALSAALVGVALPARAAPIPPGATWEQVWFPSEDGTMLHADVFLPSDRDENERHPVILSVGPYFGSGGWVPPSPIRSGPVLRFNDLITEGNIFERGYAYIQVDSRGYGGSDGCYDMGGAGEQSDAKAAVEWAASQEWSNGKVGMWGKSYDAWTQVMALAHDPKGLAATVIQSPLLEMYRGLYMNGVHYGDYIWYTMAAGYAGYDLVPPSINDSPPEEFLYPAKGTATNPHCYAEHLSMTNVPERELPYWQERDVVEAAAKSDVPTLWSHGFLDANTRADNFIDVYSKLRGPKRAWFGQYDHVRGNEADQVGRDGFMREAMAWFDHHLKGLPLKKFPPVEIQDSEGNWRSEGQWPPADARLHGLTLREGSFVDERGNDAGEATSGTWSFTQPAPYDLHFAGVPRLNLEISTQVPNANVIALVYDVDGEGDGRLITRGAYRTLGSGKLSFDLYPQDWRLRKGHRLGLLLSGSDESWFSPIPTMTEVTILGGELELPFLRFVRSNDLAGGPAYAMTQVPRIEVAKSDIRDAAVEVDFPPRLTRR